MDIENRLKAVFADVFAIDATKVGVDTKQNALESWDSLGQLRIIMAIEEAFDVSFSIDEIALLIDYETILNKLNGKLLK